MNCRGFYELFWEKWRVAEVSRGNIAFFMNFYNKYICKIYLCDGLYCGGGVVFLSENAQIVTSSSLAAMKS